MRATTRNGALGALILAALAAPGEGVAQDRERPRVAGPGLVLDEGGEPRTPTPADALRAFWRPEMLPHPGEGLRRPHGARREPALAVLGQVYGRHPAVELDALANALADSILALDVPEDMSEEYYLQSDIFSTLSWAADGEEDGTPHAGSFDALVRIYETLAARALADGGADPVTELRRSGGPSGHSQLKSALRWIFGADRTGRGADYLLAVVAASEPPDMEDVWPIRRGSLWCEAANIVRQNYGLGDHPRKGELPPLALDDEMFYQLCVYH